MNRVAISGVAEVNPPLPASVRNGDGARLVPFLPMSAVSEEGFATYAERRPLHDLLKGYTYFGRGDVIVAKITPCLENGKAANLSDLPDNVGFGSTEFHVLRPGPDIDGRYLFHAVWNNAFRRAGADAFTGSAGQKRLPASFFDRYRIPVPTLAEQRRIAAMLDKADGVRRNRREAIGLLDELLRSVFLEMFGDPVRNEKGWEVVRLGDCLQGKPVIGTIRPARENGEMCLIRVGELGRHDVTLERCGRVSLPTGDFARFQAIEGDLLLARAIGSERHLGKASVLQAVSEPVVFDSHVMRVRVDRTRIHPSFLWQWLQTSGGRREFLRQGGRTAVQFNVNASQVADVRLPLPPVNEQERFLGVASRVRAAQTRQLWSAASAQGLFRCLSQRAFWAKT